MTDRGRAAPESAAGDSPAQPAGDLAPGVMTEYVTGDWGTFIRSRALLERFRSPYQEVEVHDSVPFGKLFRLDGHFMTSEADEFYYHENLVHVPGLAHPGPERALVIGGGDGGSTEELLKYPSMKSVTVAEIDAAVVDVARRHLAAVHRGAFDDPRVTLHIGDGFGFVAGDTGSYDLIVLDLTDPGGPSTALYTPRFYQACARRLTPSGALSMHVGSPVSHGARVRSALDDLRAAFPRVTPYLASIPLYGGLWMMACAAPSLDPREHSATAVDARIAERGIAALQYVNGETYRAALALPNFVRDLLA
ncbi:MAG: polyamine aminopropyltransferase [Proteobacteria bacterium]|nr:polyamine aminopropyltransferase [Pseudomonadota bacterium]